MEAGLLVVGGSLERKCLAASAAVGRPVTTATYIFDLANLSLSRATLEDVYLRLTGDAGERA